MTNIALPFGNIKELKNLKKFFQKASSSLNIFHSKGSSMELLAVWASSFFPKVIVLCQNSKEMEWVGQNIRAYGEIFQSSFDLLSYDLARQGEEHYDKTIENDNIRALKTIKTSRRVILVANVHACGEKVPFSLEEKVLFKEGANFSRDDLLSLFIERGYERVQFVEKPMELAVRGGILDFYGGGLTTPIRIEFMDDQIETIKTFDLVSQRTLERMDEIPFYLPSQENNQSLIDYLSEEMPVFKRSHVEDLKERGFFRVHFFPHGPEEEVLQLEGKSISINSQSTENYSSKRWVGVEDFFSEISLALKGIRTIVLCSSTEGEKHRIESYLDDAKFEQEVIVLEAPLASGVCFVESGILFLSDLEIFKRHLTRPQAFRLSPTIRGKVADTLKPGELVVHYSYGVGKYHGINKIIREGREQECIEIEFQNDARLYVPKDQFFLIEKYVGPYQESSPPLDRLGGNRWQIKKNKALEAIEDYAAKMLRLEASREAHEGLSIDTSSPEMTDFEMSFPFQETPDQEKAIREVKEDLFLSQSMNRLVLGDVGYGKTEVAMRAAFATAMEGYQTAVLVPTTILAEQHYHSFSERMRAYPICVEVLSRFTSPKKARQVVESLKKGLVDILIGTHRLVQKDIEFSNLGLLIVDEEQKFGVAHKDYLVHRHPLVNILSLSATPIPRTLYLSLLGVRNMSAVMTPPQERRPIETKVMVENWDLAARAIGSEIERGGQAFFVHNRVKSIQKVKEKLENLLPDLVLEVAHGQLPEKSLKDVMDRFIDGKIDCLISTNIIESGIDLPNVNTLIIHNADQFGLAELYQLRGRIGRYNRKAYAYLMICPRRQYDEGARKRIDAIHEFSKPGGAYLVAMKDLELRGAGNILGTNQSGHIAAIGFDLYCKLLRDTIRSLKGERITPHYEVSILLKDGGGFIPHHYVPQFEERFRLYKDFAAFEKLDEIQKMEEEVKDRYGRLPSPFRRLIGHFRLKCLCRQKGILKVERRGNKIVIDERGGRKTTLTIDEKEITRLIEWVIKLIDRLFEAQVSVDETGLR